MEELGLGVRDLRERLAVDAHELEEGDEREARLEDRGGVLEQVEVGVAEALPVSEGKPTERQIRSISAGSSPVRSAASSSECGPCPPGNSCSR